MQLKSFALIAVTLLASVLADSAPKRIVPIRKGGDASLSGSLSCESVPTAGKIVNHGGRVINSTFNTYAIFYGSLWTTTQRNLLTNVMKNIGASPYYKMLSGYGVKGGSTFKKLVNDTKYSQGKSLNDNSLPLIVANSLKLGLPVDTNGIYFIFTDKTVNETGGFCSQYCGFHTNAMINGKDLLYAFVGNPQNCIAGCGPCNTVISPNNDIGVDAMASVFSHELVEAASDPLGNAWYDGQGYENADKCAYTYGQTFKTPNGAIANMKLGGKNYLIQQNWNVLTGACALA